MSDAIFNIESQRHYEQAPEGRHVSSDECEIENVCVNNLIE